MKKVAIIRELDESKMKKITIGYERAMWEGKKGYKVVASNGDEIGYYLPQTKEKCIADIYAMYDRWETFEAIN